LKSNSDQPLPFQCHVAGGIGPLPDTFHSPTPSQAVADTQDTAEDVVPPECPGPFVTHDHARPFQRPNNELSGRPQFPTAAQNALDAHDTPDNPPPNPGPNAKTLVASIDQLEPSQRSTSGAPTPPAASNGGAEPTAVQAVADVHDTPLRTLGRESAGFDWIDQRTPFQRSTSANDLPDLFLKYPTATQALREVHDTAVRTLSLEAGFAASWRDPPDAEAAAVVANSDGGHGILPVGGRRFSPLAAMVSPHGWPRFLPTVLS
jgi:hypothetical protein